MSVGTWTRFSTVPVRSLNRRPQPQQVGNAGSLPNRSALPLIRRRRVAMRAVHRGSLDLSKTGARKPTRWWHSRQAA